jgi:hypothetical protein
MKLRRARFRHRPVWARVWWWQIVLGPVRRRWRHRLPAPPPRDAEAVEIAKIEALIGRLEIATMIGSTTAAGRLVDLAEDRVGIARRRMAQEAIARLQSTDFSQRSGSKYDDGARMFGERRLADMGRGGAGVLADTFAGRPQRD